MQLTYKKIKPSKKLAPYINFYWELKGNQIEQQWERVFPDGYAGVLINVGSDCSTDNGAFSMKFGKTYVVGAMKCYKDSFIDGDTHLLGVCLQPGTFANFYKYAPQDDLTDHTVEFEKSNSFDVNKMLDNPFIYFDQFYSEKIKSRNIQLQPVLTDIHLAKGQISIYELSKKNFTTVKQLERNFKKYVGLSPKEYTNIIRFQHALHLVRSSKKERSLLDIALDCGYYDHSHLYNAIKRYTGFSPSLL